MTAAERAANLKDLEQLGHSDGLQAVFAAYWLWVYPKEEATKRNGNTNRETGKQ